VCMVEVAHVWSCSVEPSVMVVDIMAMYTMACCEHRSILQHDARETCNVRIAWLQIIDLTLPFQITRVGHL
jgi:hypothetical protein